MPTLEELEAKLDRLMTLVTTKEAPREFIPSTPSGPSADGKNPCGCATCGPQRVHHWFCSVCGSGPFKFDQASAGAMPASRPHFARGLSKYLNGRWEYGARYCCSQACVSKELRLQHANLVDTAIKRPDLADAIAAQLEAGGVGGLATIDAGIPDLGTVGRYRDGAGATAGRDRE